jgi:hypothetical protein
LNLLGETGQNLAMSGDSWKDYLIVSNYHVFSEQRKVALLKRALGEDALKFFNNLELKHEKIDTSDKILKALKDNLTP